MSDSSFDSKLGSARERAGATIRDTADRARQTARAWAESDPAATAKARVDDAVVQLREGYTEVQGELEGVVDDLTDYVRHNPGQSVLLAAGLGFLVGLLFRRGE